MWTLDERISVEELQRELHTVFASLSNILARTYNNGLDFLTNRAHVEKHIKDSQNTLFMAIRDIERAIQDDDKSVDVEREFELERILRGEIEEE